MEDQQRSELTGTNTADTNNNTPQGTHHKPVTNPGGGATSKRERPLYGPHPTHPPTKHTNQHHTHARACVWRKQATTTQQPNNSSHTITTSPYHALPNQSSRWSQRQGNARHPSRTRKLSLTAPMVLHPPGCGRVGHHRAHTTVGPMRTTQSHGPHTQTPPKVDGTVSERSI